MGENDASESKSAAIKYPEICSESISDAVKNSFAGLIAAVFSTEGAENALSELSAAGVENFEVCFGSIPDGVFSGNVLLIAPIIDKLPQKGYNKVIFADEPYCADIYSAFRAALPEAEFYRSGKRCDFADICVGFSISRDEMGLYYKTMVPLLRSKTYSVTELISKLSDVLNRPLHQTIFAVKVFRQLGFISYNNGTAVKLLQSGTKQLSESPIYRAVSQIQQSC